jgi:catechol 2,3-dioxygenase-like lactoylglutathione lyase family enzyme
MTVTALYPVLITGRLAETRAFYAELLDLEPAFDAEWFSQLISRSGEAGQIGLVARGHDSIPPRFRDAIGLAALVTVEVDDVDAVHARATAAGLPIELSLRDEDWGQRHFITRDPDGVAVDVVQVIAVTSPEAAGQYAAGWLPPGSAA